MHRRATPDFDDLLLTTNDPAGADSACWFVYLFALADCSAFKVGFSCNPLQRISAFSRRYFERFDLSQSLIVNLETCDRARAAEAEVKARFVEFREHAPAWVPVEAGGHTEWFSAVYFADADALVRKGPAIDVISAFDFFAPTLERMRESFERWAFLEAQRLNEERVAMERGYAIKTRSHALRDWLDAYAHFGMELFTEDVAAGEFVRQSAKLSIFR